MKSWAGISGALRAQYWRYHSLLRNRFGESVFCSKCFQDHGLARTCKQLGRPVKGSCRRCGAIGGIGVAALQLDDLIYEFFVYGTYRHDIGGYTPALQVSDRRIVDDIKFRDNTLRDWCTLGSVSGRTLFHYGPALWRFGLTSHWAFDDSGDVVKHFLSRSGIERALGDCVVRIFDIGALIYRVRLNLTDEQLTDDCQFDSPPIGRKSGFDRFDDASTSILYAGRTIDVCLHEVRLSNRDRVTLGTLEVVQSLKLLDITGDGSEAGQTPFDDPEIFFNGLVFSNTTHAECRQVASAIRERGYDGFLYKSYHSPVMSSPGVNIALFGWPVMEGKLAVRSVNNVFLGKIRANYHLGPVFGPDEELTAPRDAMSAEGSKPQAG